MGNACNFAQDDDEILLEEKQVGFNFFKITIFNFVTHLCFGHRDCKVLALRRDIVYMETGKW